MTDTSPRLAPRSAVAAADLELLRVARTELDSPEAPASASFTGRLLAFARFVVSRPGGDSLGPRIDPGSSED